MKKIKKLIEMDQDQIVRVKRALKAKTEEEAISLLLAQFDTELQLAQVTLKDSGKFDFEEA